MSIKIIDTTFYSIGFPNENWSEMINRNNYISQIEDYFSAGVKILFLEGEEDSGKTTLCAQFAKKNVENTITIFFNPLNTLDFQIDYYCSNLVSQIKHILKEQPLSEENYIGTEQYQQCIFQLRKMLKSGTKKINIVIDGLENTIKEDSDFIKQLFSIVPFGEDIFRIIISGNKTDFLALYPKIKREEIKSINLAGFSEPEIVKYLELKDHSANDIRELFNITKGYPGRLKTLKRLIQSESYSLENISSATTYKNWVELDCESIDYNKPINNGILSLFSLSDKTFPPEEILKIFSLSQENFDITLLELNVLEVSGRNVNFISNAHKKYFANILRGNKKKVDELLINFYSNYDSISSLIELPRLLATSNQWPKVINILDDKYLPKIIENTGSLKIVNETLELGVKASQELKQYSDLWRFSIQGGIVNELDNYLFWESEIEARTSIHDFAGSISLAESAVLKVDRLKLLSLVARRQKELNKKVDEDLSKLIVELYETTDLSSVGDKIYDIVTNLIYAIPNLAIEMIEKTSGEVSEKNINDWIVAKLSIAAIDSNIRENENLEGSKKLQAIEGLNSQLAKKINKAISFLVGNYSSNKVLEEVEKLTDSREKLRLLRLWLNNNRRNIKDVDKVIDKALDALVSSSAEAPTTLDILKDLSNQLPYVKDPDSKDRLYKKFRTIEKGLSDSGLAKNKYIYELNMFHTEFILQKDGALRTLNGIINEIDKIEDVLMKLESFSEVYSKLCIVKGPELKTKINFIYSRVLTLSKELYSSTASHFKISQYLLKTVGKRNPKLGLKISEEINTEYRRESARLLILDSYLENSLKNLDFSAFNEIEAKLQYLYSKQRFHFSILERYAETKGVLHFEVVKSLVPYIDKIEDITDISKKHEAYVLAYKIVSKNVVWKKKLANRLESQIFNSWLKIEADWERIDTGFNTCFDLSKINQTLSKRLFEESEKIKKDSWLDSKPVAFTYMYSIKLVIRAYLGLVTSKNETSSDYKILEDLIGRVPSEIEKINLWTELGLHLYAINNPIVKKVLDDHVLPLIQGIVNKKLSLQPVFDSLTLIHLFNPDLTLEYLKNVSEEDKENVFANICHYYITKHSPFETYDGSIFKFNNSYSDLTKALSILNYIRIDGNIYYHLSNICEAIAETKSTLSEPQILSLLEGLSEIVSKRFPDPKNIKHDGYKLLSEMKIAKLKKGVNHKVFWQDIINQVEQIPNMSDKIFIKAFLLDEVPFDKMTNGSEVKTKLYEEVLNSLNSLNVHFEFIQRVTDISDMMFKINKTKWKVVVSRAFTISNDLEKGSDIYSSQRKIIDSMYRLDPDYAKELIKLNEKGNEENKLNNMIKEHLEVLEISKKIKDNKSLELKEKENSRKIVAAISATLASLNSYKTTSKKIPEASRYFPLGNTLPLHEVFPIYFFYLANCLRTYGTMKLDGVLSNLHKNNFKEAVKATNLIQLLSHRRKFSEKTARKFFIDEDFSSNQPIRPSSREDAFSIIKSWVQDEADTFIIIADPYFQKEDIEILKIIKEVNSTIEIDILGSKSGLNSNAEIEFKQQWKKISDETAPFTNFTFCWVPEDNNDTPFHDRWIITKNGGLRLGCSLNSLGIDKESEISIMKPSEALKIKENSLLEYIGRRKKERNSQRISYNGFSL